jgi:arylsulfatase A-like enzyme
MRHCLFLSFFLFLLANAWSNQHEDIFGKRPNIVFLFADDQRADTISAHGNPHIQTPHLDRLAETGFSFLRNYCAGSYSGAVCVASRSMLMTGRHWMSLPPGNKSRNWVDLPLLPSELKARAGYRTFIVGKWHNGEDTLKRAFSNGKSIYMGGMVNHADFQVQDYDNGILSDKRDAGGFSSTVFADTAIEYIESAETGQPFFLYVALTAPHDTRNPPEAYRELYYKNRPPLPENFLPYHPFVNAPQVTQGRDEGLAPWPRTPEVIGDQLCEYYGLITHLDEQIGRIVEAIKKSPQGENTIIIYTADHGLAMGSHGLLGKQNIYEQSMRAPLIIHGRGIPEGLSNSSYTYVHDLYATLLDIAELRPAPDTDALSLVPIMNGKVEKVRDRLFLPFQDNQRAVSDGNWKLHVYPKINHRLLFNLKDDPHETKNLAEDSAHKGQLNRMMAMMESTRTQYGDKDPLFVANPESKIPNYNNDERTLDIWQPKWIRDKYFGGRSNPNHGN